MNPAAVIIINLALLFYSIGVWSERIQGRLKICPLPASPKCDMKKSVLIKNSLVAFGGGAEGGGGFFQVNLK